MHRRQIDLQVFLRDDGLWEVDARITDVKSYDWKLKTGVRAAGEPIHDMTLRVVVDAMFNIVDAGAHTDAMPYPGHCSEHGDAYRRLIGLNLVHGFRAGLKERLGGVLGCTHITELAQTLPTVLIQAYAGVGDVAEREGDRQPMQIDRCHANWCRISSTQYSGWIPQDQLWGTYQGEEVN